jgi:oligoribonuclease NrnB/cAMP/cGMP phosphodiesterase (DHH superfamily)
MIIHLNQRMRKHTMIFGDENVIGVSHEEDIDGIGSAAILLRVLGVRNIVLTNYHREKWYYAVKKIRGYCESLGNITIYITDLNLKKWMINSLDHGLSNCVKKIYWIDHHLWDKESDELTDKLGYYVKYNDAKHTASENLAEFLGVKEDPVVDLIKILSRDSDFGIMQHFLTEPLTDLIRYLVYIKKSKALLKKLVRKISRGVFWDYETELLWRNAYKMKREVVENTLRNYIYKEVDDRKIYFFFTEPVTSSYSLLKSFGEKHDLAIVIFSNGSITIVRGRDRDDIDCSEIARRLGGGGHRHIAGVQVRRRMIIEKDLLLQRIINVLREYFEKK